jgi:sulfite exporter TauE/SafE
MWLTALLIGLAGSLHCAGMCSPLVLAATSNKPFLLSKIIYNSGRVLVYAVMGAFAGAMGSILPVHREQNIVSVVVGILLLLIGVGVIKNVRVPFLDKWIGKVISNVKSYFGKFLKVKSGWATFLLGTLNGIMPCGLTYMALAYCVVLPSAKAGFLFMLVFGLGTWPVMIGLTWLVRAFFKSVHLSYHRLTAGIFLISGILLIGRVFMQGHAKDEMKIKASPSGNVSVCK